MSCLPTRRKNISPAVYESGLLCAPALRAAAGFFLRPHFLYIRRTRHGANQGLGSDLCLSGQLRQYFRTYELSVRQRLEAGLYRPQRPRQDDLFEALDGGISLSGACRRADGLRLFSLCGAASRIPGWRGVRGDRPRCAVLAARARDGSAWAG